MQRIRLGIRDFIEKQANKQTSKLYFSNASKIKTKQKKTFI